MAQSYERDRDRRGFKELAKLAGAPSRPSSRPSAGSISGVRRADEESDSGLIDLHALAKSDPGAVDRASVTPLASEPMFGDAVDGDDSPTQAFTSSPAPRLSPPPSRPSSMPPPLSLSVEAARQGSLPIPPSVLRPIEARAAVAPAPRRKSALLPLVSVVGFAALAAGAFFVVRTVRAHGVSASAPIAALPAVGSPPAPAANLAVVTPAQAAVAQAPVPAADPGVDPLTLPKDTPVTAGHRGGHALHVAHAGPAAVAKAEPKEAEEPAPAPAVAKAEAAKEVVPTGTNALLDSMKQSTVAAAPAPEAAVPVPAAAAAGPGGVAPHPSQGQVTGALGAVVPQARICLNEEDGVSRAHVLFGSDGAVQSVAISGWASGKPAEACIKTALGKAHVPAFAEPTYGATVTIRP